MVPLVEASRGIVADVNSKEYIAGSPKRCTLPRPFSTARSTFEYLEGFCKCRANFEISIGTYRRPRTYFLKSLCQRWDTMRVNWRAYGATCKRLKGYKRNNMSSSMATVAVIAPVSIVCTMRRLIRLSVFLKQFWNFALTNYVR